MNCPSCHITLLISNRGGIEIDYCLQCRGVWLGCSELDEIIERSATHEKKWLHDDSDDNRHQSEYGEHKKHRKSLLGKLPDIG